MSGDRFTTRISADRDGLHIDTQPHIFVLQLMDSMSLKDRAIFLRYLAKDEEIRQAVKERLIEEENERQDDDICERSCDADAITDAAERAAVHRCREDFNATGGNRREER